MKTQKTDNSIDITISEKTIVKREVFYFRESAIQSILADCVTFGFIIGGLILNHTLLHARWYIDIFFILLFFVVSGSRGSNKAHRFTNLEEFKKYVKEMK